MTKLLSAAGASFLRAFGASLLVLVLGVLAAPNVEVALGLSIAAVVASIAAGLKAVQVFVPQLSFSSLIGNPWGAWVDAFARGFVGALIVGVTGALAAPDLATARALGFAAVVGALTAGFRALQGLTTPGESPGVEGGIGTP